MKKKISLETLIDLEREGKSDQAIAELLGVTKGSVTNARYRLRRADKYPARRRVYGQVIPAGENIFGLLSFQQAIKEPGRSRKVLRLRADLLGRAEQHAQAIDASLSHVVNQALEEFLAGDDESTDSLS